MTKEWVAPAWLCEELAELRERLRGTIGNDYARVVEDIERRLADEPKAGTCDCDRENPRDCINAVTDRCGCQCHSDKSGAGYND